MYLVFTVCLHSRVSDTKTNEPSTSCPATCPLHHAPLLQQENSHDEEGKGTEAARRKQIYSSQLKNVMIALFWDMLVAGHLLKCWHLSSKVRGITSQEIIFFSIAVRTVNLAH
jgi:hypothetical protein